MPTASYLTTEKYLCTQKNGSWNPRGERKITADEHQRARKVVPSTTQRLTEQETIRQSIIERQPHQPHPTVPWPASSGTPINEFDTEGYISCVFLHTLFNWSCWHCSSTTKCSHYRQILQTPSHVWIILVQHASLVQTFTQQEYVIFRCSSNEIIQNDAMCHNKCTWYLMKGFIPSITTLSEL